MNLHMKDIDRAYPKPSFNLNFQACFHNQKFDWSFKIYKEANFEF